MRRALIVYGIAVALVILGFYLPQAKAQLPATQCVSSALAGGTADVLTIPNLPCSATSTLLILTLSSTNTTVAPTLQMTGGAALPIVNADGSAVTIGQLKNGMIVLLAYTGSQWRLV